jgi:D-alanyl-lipoteichoic acid acyltransferase DltB (MBOAT superfamily)
MTFTTLTFVLFLALVFSLYWAFRNRNAQNALIVVTSFIFYGWWDWRFCGLMLAASLIDFFAGLGLDRAQRKSVRRLYLFTSMACNLGMLGFFKYYNFFADSLHAALAQIGWEVQPWTLRVVLPVGISFYTFQTMSYALDIYFGKLKATGRIIDYLAYVSFFPQLVAGPIERATNLLPQFYKDRRFDERQATDGCRQILWGFFKKIVIADQLSPLVDDVYSRLGSASGPEIALATVLFAFQIYCDFSAYSDIAIGTARLFGFELMRNFAYPYFSQSVTEFWRRWHISLSTWFRDYVYVPLGGSRTTRGRLIRNILVTFVLSGLWHGANWTFVIWGGIMGLAIALEVLLQSRRPGAVIDTPGGERLLPELRTVLRIAFTFSIICLGWVFFRAASVTESWAAIQSMATGLFDPAGYQAAAEFLRANHGRTILVCLGILLLIEWLQRRHPHPLVLPAWSTWQRWSLYTVLLWYTLYSGPKENSPFIYFQF